MAVRTLQREVAKIGLLKHHGIPLDDEQARKARETFTDSGVADDVVAAFDKLLVSAQPQDAVRLAGIVLLLLERSEVEGEVEGAGVRQIRLVVDAAGCSESEVVRSFLMEVADRAGHANGACFVEKCKGVQTSEGATGIGDSTETQGVEGRRTSAGVHGQTSITDLGCMADDLVELVDDGLCGAEDADEVERLVLRLAKTCGMGAAGREWAERILCTSGEGDGSR